MSPTASRRIDRRRGDAAILALALTLALALASGCGSESAEDRLAEATGKVKRIEQDVSNARVAVEREEAEVASAQEELAEAREWLQEAEARLAEAKAAVAEEADDAYLFRAVQTVLLADPALNDLAIAARVQDGVVTLEGSVPKPEQRKRAGQLAEGILGVERVENRVRVEAPPPS